MPRQSAEVNAVVTVKIVSGQVKNTQDAQGKTVEGNSTAVTPTTIAICVVYLTSEASIVV
jgi:hypothetical protein